MKAKSKSSQANLLRTVIVRFVGGLVVIGAILFLPAGTLSYWQAWAYCATIFIPVLFFGTWLFRNNPELLARRMKLNERRGAQKKVISLSFIAISLGFFIPGLDYRFHLSQVPTWLVLVSLGGVLLGYLITALTLRENSYASRVIEIGKGQKVVETGPYSLVRHPMYLGMVVFLLFTSTALGSFWALIPFGLSSLLLIPRIIDEETLLVKSLPGYRAYSKKVKYRLFPLVW
jgi:protein-S-isoprenylcysteine O-methyltransferase Ste14